jgi:hypothetical protein
MSSGLGGAISAGFSQALGSGTRQIWPIIILNGVDVSSTLYPNLHSVRFRQTWADTFDDVTIVLVDPDDILASKWPANASLSTGLSLALSVKSVNWRWPGDAQLISLGAFSIDEIVFSGQPSLVTIRAVAAAAQGLGKWSNLTISRSGTLYSIGVQIAQECGLTFQPYPAAAASQLQNVKVAPGSALQSNCSDLVFYDELCRRNFYATKVHGNILYAFDPMSLDTQTPLFTITKPTVGQIGGLGLGLKSWSFRQSTQDNSYFAKDNAGRLTNVMSGKTITTQTATGGTVDSNAAINNIIPNAVPSGQQPPVINNLRPPLLPQDEE